MIHVSDLANETDIKNILVLGYSVRHIVCSGARAGYNMYAVDCYSDVDTRAFAVDCKMAESVGLSDAEIMSIVGGWDLDFDAVILSSGFEEKRLPWRTLSNKPEIVRKVSDKRWLTEKVEDLGFICPRIFDSQDEIEFPAVARPIRGAGGWRNIMVECESDLPDNWDDGGAWIIQEYVEGVDASVSTISTADEHISAAVNEQLLGVDYLNAPCRFSYCGNITPLRTDYETRMRRIAEDIVLELGLLGSNGVDMIIGRGGEIYIAEVNPRFQASLDTVEMSTGISLLHSHVLAFEDKLTRVPKYSRYAAKQVLYASRDIAIEHDLSKTIGTADIPPAGRLIKKDGPLISVMCMDSSKDGATGACKGAISDVKSTIGL